MKSNLDQLVRCTVRILAFQADGAQSSGSGLFMQLHPFDEHPDKHTPVIVTNKHVIRGCDYIRCSWINESTGANYTINIEVRHCLPHPDPNIDLAIIPVSDGGHKDAFSSIRFMPDSFIYGADRLEELNAIESVIMIGYPNGLIDTKGFYPISRKGVTATPPYASYNNKPDFMIDCACFPGSSGSPVFIADQGIFTDRENKTTVGSSRFGLIGFLYAGPTRLESGEIVNHEPPVELKQMVNFPMMLNLGICVRAAELKSFYPALREKAVE